MWAVKDSQREENAETKFYFYFPKRGKGLGVNKCTSLEGRDCEFLLYQKRGREPWLVWLSGLNVGLEPKGHQLNSQSEHMPRLWARSPVGSMPEATTH